MNNYICTGGCSPCPPPCPAPNSCPAPQPRPMPQPQNDYSCPCADSFRRALNLLCRSPLSGAVDFNSFAYVTDHYVLGTALKPLTCGDATGDNLKLPSGTYVCQDCGEQIPISGPIYPLWPDAGPICLSFNQASLCHLTAIAFGCLTEQGENPNSFQQLCQSMSQLLQPNGCNPGLRTVSVAAGGLLVENVMVLGQLGNLLILANSNDQRIYLICLEKVEFMG